MNTSINVDRAREIQTAHQIDALYAEPSIDELGAELLLAEQEVANYSPSKLQDWVDFEDMLKTLPDTIKAGIMIHWRSQVVPHVVESNR